MRRIRLCYCAAFLICLNTILLGCQTQNVNGEQPAAIRKSEWATLDHGLKPNANGFPSRISVAAIDGRPFNQHVFRVVELRGKLSCRERNSCVLHPGTHSIGLEYVWSKTETVDQRKKKTRWEAWSAATIVLGGNPYIAEYQDSRCRVLIDFEVQEAKIYTINVIHSDGQKEPAVFQVVNKESGLVTGSQSQCDMQYETALPYSDEHVPIDQCAIHLISSISDPMTIYLGGSHPYYAYHMNHTLLVEPGDHVIDVYSGRRSPTNKPKGTNALNVQCDGGQARYVHIDADKGTWANKLTLNEISEEDAELALSGTEPSG